MIILKCNICNSSNLSIFKDKEDNTEYIKCNDCSNIGYLDEFDYIDINDKECED